MFSYKNYCTIQEFARLNNVTVKTVKCWIKSNRLILNRETLILEEKIQKGTHYNKQLKYVFPPGIYKGLTVKEVLWIDKEYIPCALQNNSKFRKSFRLLSPKEREQIYNLQRMKQGKNPFVSFIKSFKKLVLQS